MEQQNMEAWLKEEEEQLGTGKDFERLPSLKLEENKPTEIEVDSSQPFQKWSTTMPRGVIVKAIIPVLHSGEKKNFWLNVKNPLYAEIVRACRTGQKTFKIMQTGSLDKTRYILLK